MDFQAVWLSPNSSVVKGVSSSEAKSEGERGAESIESGALEGREEGCKGLRGALSGNNSACSLYGENDTVNKLFENYF